MNDANGKELTLVNYKASTITGVEIGKLGHKLWVCVDGVCVLRVQSPEIHLADNRKDEESSRD